ncbi:MAG: hypothetical protein RIT07_1757, partial [Bacteroidota bacterium]
NYGDDGVRNGAVIQLQVHAVEMVYVPQGSFYLGNTGSYDYYSFTDGSWTTGAGTPYLVNTEGAIGIDNAAGKLWATTTGATTPPSQLTVIGNNTTDAEATLDAAFPKGYNAFYCMKYELTQGQYRDFLNTLTYNQQTKMVMFSGCLSTGSSIVGRLILSNGNGTTLVGYNSPYFKNGLAVRILGNANTLTPAVIGCDFSGTTSNRPTPNVFNQANDGMWLACNVLSWPMSAAYLDWAGLRPMTEMELEKAARGSEAPVANEGAMGITISGASTNYTTGYTPPGTATEASGTTAQYHVCGVSTSSTDTKAGVTRVGSLAKSNSSRQSSGASYWGIMELSGNVLENTVSVATGRSFTGTHGDGTLSSNGYANAATWPGLSSGEVTGTTGVMPRGGGILHDYTYIHDMMKNPISSRYWVTFSWPPTFTGIPSVTSNLQWVNLGNRGVRTAP